MPVQVVVPDLMGELRAALRALSDLSTLTGSRVFFSTPEGATFPLIRLTEAGGALAEVTPTPTQRVFIEVIGAKPSDYYKVDQAKRIIVSWIWALTGPLGATTQVLDGSVDTVIDQPDPDSGAPRKVISAVFTVVAR